VKILGAVLAGGASRRFGSDKALAMLAGRPLIDHAIAALAEQCAAVVVCGRAHPGAESVPDRPEPGQGPLGGLSGALCHAEAQGFDAVLSAACDNAGLPGDLLERLHPGPAHAADQPVIGLWPASLSSVLDAWLAGQDDRSMRGFIAHVGARAVQFDAKPANINTLDDLARLERYHGV
jgi:molybdopterin-guanine dinucleotide biosynthesis protein A